MINSDDLNKMRMLYKIDSGMQDLLNKAYAYYLLSGLTTYSALYEAGAASDSPEDAMMFKLLGTKPPL